MGEYYYDGSSDLTIRSNRLQLMLHREYFELDGKICIPADCFCTDTADGCWQDVRVCDDLGALNISIDSNYYIRPYQALVMTGKNGAEVEIGTECRIEGVRFPGTVSLKILPFIPLDRAENAGRAAKHLAEVHFDVLWALWLQEKHGSTLIRQLLNDRLKAMDDCFESDRGCTFYMHAGNDWSVRIGSAVIRAEKITPEENGCSEILLQIEEDDHPCDPAAEAEDCCFFCSVELDCGSKRVRIYPGIRAGRYAEFEVCQDDEVYPVRLILRDIVSAGDQ